MKTQAANAASAANPVLLGIDRIVDFATLGEYRVVTGSVPKSVEDNDIWAQDLEWVQDIEWDAHVSTAARLRPSCSLPRARDRRLARERVNG